MSNVGTPWQGVKQRTRRGPPRPARRASRGGYVTSVAVAVAVAIPVTVAIPVRMGPVPGERIMVAPPFPRIAVIMTVAVRVAVVALTVSDARAVRPDIETEASLGICRRLRNCDRGSCQGKSDDRALDQRSHRFSPLVRPPV